MRNVPKTRIAAKAGTTVLALSMFASSIAAARCASPEDMVALRVAALRQQLMVAALACHEAGSFNRFVIAYRGDLQISDRALMRFFARASRNPDDAYNAYKTKMANDSSLRSLSDPWFCGNADASFAAALDRGAPLAELVSEQAVPIETGFASCGMAPTEAAQSGPRYPSRHRTMPDGAAVDTASPSNPS